MDNDISTPTIKAEFILILLGLCEEKYHDLISGLLEKLGHDISNPLNKIPILAFREMCDSLEHKIGRLQTKFIARSLGNLLYEKMVKQNIIEKRPHPLDMVNGFLNIMSQYIENVNMKLVDSGLEFVLIPDSLFCSATIQNGIFENIVSKCGKVVYPFQSQRKSSPDLKFFDQMMLTWKNWKNK